MRRLVTWRTSVWLVVLPVVWFLIIPPWAVRWIPPDLYEEVLIALMVAVLLVWAIFWSGIGLRAIGTGTFDGRAWGLLFLLMGVMSIGIALEVLPGTAQRDPGGAATGLALGGVSGILSLRRAVPMKYPKSRLRLLALWVFVLVATTWMVVTKIHIIPLKHAMQLLGSGH